MTSSERRSRPGASWARVSRTSPRTTSRLPGTINSRASARPRSKGAQGLAARPWRRSWPSASKRAWSAGQSSRRSLQKAGVNGEFTRSNNWASNRLRRLSSSSLLRCWASSASSRARRMSASSALRSRSSRARWRVTSGLSGAAPGAGPVPSCCNWALRSFNRPLRWLINSSVLSLTAAIWFSSGFTSSLLLAVAEMRSNWARSSVSVVASGAAWAEVNSALNAIKRQKVRRSSRGMDGGTARGQAGAWCPAKG